VRPLRPQFHRQQRKIGIQRYVMIPRTALLIWVLLFAGVMLSAQSTPATAEPYCKTISHGMHHGNELTTACEFAESLLQKLPNVLCDQTTERFRAKLNRMGMDKPKRHDVVTATVRYFEGAETYTDIKVDGKPQPALLKNGAWAAGEYGATMGFIFSEQSSARFHFVGEKTLRSVPAVLFEFTIDRKNNRQWSLQGPGSKGRFPGLRGQLWLEKNKGRIMRTEIQPTDFGDWIANLSIETDYDDVQLGDASTFLLPVASASESCNLLLKLCSRNVATFRNCHRFAAKSRILSFSETGENSP
jgi:hypothetical protein